MGVGWFCLILKITIIALLMFARMMMGHWAMAIAKDLKLNAQGMGLNLT